VETVNSPFRTEAWIMPNITTCLWFDREAEEAANFYVRVFSEGGRGARIRKVARYGDAGAKASGQPKDTVMTVEFELDGNEFLGLNGGPHFKFTPAVSFIVFCQTQAEIDYFWQKLGEGGKEGQCGWIERDKFGVSWQIVPTLLGELMKDPDKRKSERAMKALMTMKKLDIETLKRAAERG
jgi:predicted 3-demethylubiquinone-9 3-methyltransferase (glyoxalase superfamily)